ncbi:MAG TPA: DoxX family membrane protein [Anditalea sp.]|nr:DoxX family membrane protein [Anditalea sp.]
MYTKFIVSSISVTIFRMMLSGIFLVASTSHLFKVDQTIDRINQARFKDIAYMLGDPKYSVIASGIGMLVAGISLLVGFKVKWAAIILALILIPITLTVQLGSIENLGPLFKNIAIMGGLLFFILNDFKANQPNVL